jgi:hypothetical protein
LAGFLAPPKVTLEGSPLVLICESDNKEPIGDCRFSVPGFASEIKIFSGSRYKHDKYEFVGDGLDKGQCGLKLYSVNRINAGKVKCRVILNSAEEQVNETEVTVLHPIEKLEIDSNSNTSNEYQENATMEFNCTAEGGFPSPTLSLFIGMNFIRGNMKFIAVCWAIFKYVKY